MHSRNRQRKGRSQDSQRIRPVSQPATQKIKLHIFLPLNADIIKRLETTYEISIHFENNSGQPTPTNN